MEAVEIQVMGAGSLGSLLGALLADAGHEVHLVGRARHVEAIRRDGLRVTGDTELLTEPYADTEPTDSHLTLVTVKSYDTREAAEALRGKQDVVVSLQNGMGNESVLADVLDCDVLAGTTTYGARLYSPGAVEYSGGEEVVVGPREGGGSSVASEVTDALNQGLEARMSEEMPRELWTKLAVNAGINPVTALTRLTNGEAVDGAEPVVRKAAREAGEVARAEEVGIQPKALADEAVEVARATAENRSSTLRDVERGRPTEIEALNGYVVRRGDRHGVDVPVNRTMRSLVAASSGDL